MSGLCAAGFRRRRTTEEQAAALTARIQQGFADGKVTLVVFVDHRAAFDKTWNDGILHKLLGKGVPVQMVRWYASFLRGRTARVRWGTALSKDVQLREGIPQGTCSGPTLFAAYCSDPNNGGDKACWTFIPPASGCL